MDKILDILREEPARTIFSVIIFLVAIAFVILLYRWVVRKLRIRVGKSNSRLDDFIVDVLRMPFLCLLIWIAVKIFSQSMFYDTRFIGPLNHGLQILLIVTIGWIIIKLNKILFYYLEKKVEEETDNRFQMRGNQTKLNIFERMVNGLLVLVIVAVCLMTFDQIRSIGVGLLSSAGIAGVVLGFAAQKSLGSMLAGIQIAITQPIKLNDLVVIDGMSGRIEEINLTYVVVNVWDRRRLIIPINYFLENKIENWTRYSSDILGQVFFYVDYRIPVEDLRDHLMRFVADNPNWDGKTCSLDVNKLSEVSVELRALVSAQDSDKSTTLQYDIREEMLKYIQTRYPEYLTQTRVNLINQESPSAEDSPKDIPGPSVRLTGNEPDS